MDVSIYEKVRETLQDFHMIRPGDAVLVGFSGGPDSSALLYILRELSRRFPFRLAAAHLHHGLRGAEADRDADFAAEQAQRWGIPCVVEYADVDAVRRKRGLSTEEAARHVRFTFLEKLADSQGFTRIALGHHQDDNAESVLMRILRGTGVTGLSGIPPVRADRIIRPLFFLHRAEILQFLAAERIAFVMDSSNRVERFLRSRVRNRLIPMLETKYNPKICSALNRLADIVREEDRWAKQEARRAMQRICLPDELTLPAFRRDAFNALAVALRRRIVRLAVSQAGGSLRDLGWGHVDDVLDQCQSSGGRLRIDLPKGLTVTIEGNAVRFLPRRDTRRKGPGLSPYSYPVPPPGDDPVCIEIQDAGIRIRFSRVPVPRTEHLKDPAPEAAFFDLQRLAFPMELRNWRPGDRFQPLGVAGHQKVQKFFIDRKVPPPQRVRCPLLVSDDRVVWVVGHRIDDSVKITPQTRAVIKGEVLLA